MGRTIVHVGDIGAGCVAKLVTQYLGYTNLITSLEGFVIPHLGSPRIGLSVHTLSGLQAVLLLALGLAWPTLVLSAACARIASASACARREERSSSKCAIEASESRQPINRIYSDPSIGARTLGTCRAPAWASRSLNAVWNFTAEGSPF